MPQNLAALIGQASRLRVGFLLEPVDAKPGAWNFYLGATIKRGPGVAEEVVADALKAAAKKRPPEGVPEGVMRASLDRARRLAGLPPHNWNAPRFVAPPPPPPPPKARPPVPVPVKPKAKITKPKKDTQQWNLF
jgi:hypothetical protein